MSINISNILFTTEMVGLFSIEIGTTVIDFFPLKKRRKWEYGKFVESDDDSILSGFGLGPLLLISKLESKYDR